MSRRHSARATAARVLAAVCDGQSLNTVLTPALAKLRETDRPLARELVYGSLREWPYLVGLIQQCVSKPLKARDMDVQGLLVLGLYQLGWMRIPSHAAVTETVEACRHLGKGWAAGMTNAVLRRFMRERETLDAQLNRSTRDAMPGWLWQTIRRQWPAQAEQIFLASRQHPPMTLRVNTQQQHRDSWLTLLRDAGLAGSPSPDIECAVTLEKPIDVHALPGFADGAVSVQDESAQLAALLLDPKPGETVLDACAAPGGKTGHLLELCPSLTLVASDSSDQRLDLVRENLARLKLEADIRCVDASAAVECFGERCFDAILADVPCSATGVIRRNPDIKVLREERDIDSFVAQQRDILTGLWPTLKPGGRLLYVTCSLLEQENDGVVGFALDTLPGAKRADLSVPHSEATEFGYQRLPRAEGGDGLFFALLERSA